MGRGWIHTWTLVGTKFEVPSFKVGAQVPEGMFRLLWKCSPQPWPEAGCFQAASEKDCWEAVGRGRPHTQGLGQPPPCLTLHI